MNEIIKELEKQAYVTIESKVKKGGWDNDREPYEYVNVTETKFSPEKFAELIKQECLASCYHMGKDSGPITADLIKIRISSIFEK